MIVHRKLQYSVQADEVLNPRHPDIQREAVAPRLQQIARHFAPNHIRARLAAAAVRVFVNIVNLKNRTSIQRMKHEADPTKRYGIEYRVGEYKTQRCRIVKARGLSALLPHKPNR